MAVGFEYVQEHNLNNLGHEHFLATAMEAASRLGWNVSFISETGFIAYTTF